ncbi:MAG: S8 family serine peptidase, partial [Planctomycetota bacterium]
MIARPFQLKDLQARGMDRAEALAHRAAARQSLSNFRIREYVPETDETILFVPAGMTENQVAAQLMATGDFQYVEPDWIVFPIACPNDPRFGSQWHHQANRLDSCAGWNITTGNPSVSVGICDTGVLTTHEDLQLHRLEGYNAVDRLWESQGGQIGPVHPHGTMTTGCAAANGNNGIGVSGVGWDFSHRMLRVSNSSSGSASLSDLQNAARTAVQAGDKVASVSYSGVDTSSNLTTATFIKSIGGLLVWAAGNDGRNLTFGNRDNDDIIVAGATDPNDSIASFSAFGAFVDVTAPGVNVLTTDGSGNTAYAAVSGTSFATPLTAGLIALIWSANPALTPDQVEGTLKQGADDLGAAGIDNTFGYGRINVFNSVSLAGGGGGTPPVADFTGSPTTGTAPLTVDFTDQSTGAPASWAWDFGDGNTSSAQNPSHVYANAGTFTVSMTASNANGSDTLVRSGYITVNTGGSPPVADFTGSPTTGTAPLTVDFTDQST